MTLSESSPRRKPQISHITIVNDEWEGIWKETVMIYLTVLSHRSGGTEVKNVNHYNILSLNRDSNPGATESEAQC
jgi:hypothetical protein